MLKYLIGLAFVFSAFVANKGSVLQNSAKLIQSRSSGRIIGGQKANIILHPHQVSLRRIPESSFDEVPEHLCAGSIISPTIILTAAHCLGVTKVDEYLVTAGSSQRRGSDSIVVKVKRIIKHEQFKSRTYTNDVAILIISPPLPLNNFTIKAIELDKNVVPVGALVTATGWGKTQTEFLATFLEEVQVPIISNEHCTEDYHDMDRRWVISEDQICAGLRGIGGKDACNGDSGGPLTLNGKLIGIISYGRDCASAKYPGVYARISHHYQWILKKMALFK